MDKILPPNHVYFTDGILIWSHVFESHGYNIYDEAGYLTTVKGRTYTTMDGNSSPFYKVVSLGKDSDDSTIYSSKSAPAKVLYSEYKGEIVVPDPEPEPPIQTGERLGTEPDHVVSDYDLVFEDQFELGFIDYKKWVTELPWGSDVTINDEEQYYVDVQDDIGFIGNNPFIFDGNSSVAIRASELSDYDQKRTGKRYGSGKLCSVHSYIYGYFEARIRFPCDVQGFWSAFWLLNRYYGSHPEAVGDNGKRDTEVDIEFVNGTGKPTADGGFGGGPYDVNDVRYAYHYDAGWSIDGSGFHGPDDQPGQSQTCDGRQIFHHQGLKSGDAGTICGEYHTHGIDWQPDRIVYYLDGIEQDSICHEGIISQIPMYIIVNQAVGGGFPGPADPLDYSNGVDMDIDWIRVFQKTN